MMVHLDSNRVTRAPSYSGAPEGFFVFAQDSTFYGDFPDFPTKDLLLDVSTTPSGAPDGLGSPSSLAATEGIL